jgi:hypothetical protein
VRPRRATDVLLLLLATTLTVLAAPPVGAEAPASKPVVAPIDETPALVSPRAGAGWMTAPTPTLTNAPRTAHAPLAHRWWFWASLGAAAVAVVIAGFVLKPGQPYSGNASPGVDPLP